MASARHFFAAANGQNQVTMSELPEEVPAVTTEEATAITTNNTPPNQRKLAESDALVKLIQTTEYLEDTPMWGQRDNWFYPLGMVTLFIEEEEGAEEEV